MKKLLFQENLKILMKEKGITQVTLAEKTGLSQSAISLYIRGKNTPKAGELQRMADALNVSMDYLWRQSEIEENSYFISEPKETKSPKSPNPIEDWALSCPPEIDNTLDMIAQKNYTTKTTVVRNAIMRFVDMMALQGYDFCPSKTTLAKALYRKVAEEQGEYDSDYDDNSNDSEKNAG